MDVEARVKSLADVEVSDIGQRYKMQEELGSGAQATVYKGQNKKTGGKVAIKVLELQELEDDELFDALRMEIGLLRQVSAPACPSRPHSCGSAGVPCPRAVAKRVAPPIECASPWQLNHPYVVNLVEVVRDKSYVYIIQVRSRLTLISAGVAAPTQPHTPTRVATRLAPRPTRPLLALRRSACLAGSSSSTCWPGARSRRTMLSPSSHRRARPSAHRTPRTREGVA